MISTVQSPARSVIVSLGFTVWTISAMVLAFAAADGQGSSLSAFSTWLHTHWWTTLVGLILNPAPIYRARQAILNAQKGP